MDRYLRCNQQLWDEWADINFQSALYDVANFTAHPTPLHQLEIDGVGDVVGKSLLHLQCHFGKDTLRLALMGAQVTGIDFSEKAIGYARELASAMGIPARFIQTDIYDLPNVLDEQFDVIFTSYGVLCWLPDLDRWGQIVGRYLKPGGVFFIIEAHPTLYMFDDNDPTELRVKYPYFNQPEPIVIEPHIGNYADPTAPVTHAEYSWQHSVSEIVNSLLAAGLRLEYLREYPHVIWQAFPFLVTDDGEYWRLPAEYPGIPLSFAIRAIKE